MQPLHNLGFRKVVHLMGKNIAENNTGEKGVGHVWLHIFTYSAPWYDILV